MKTLKEQFYEFNKPIIDMWDNEYDDCWNEYAKDLPKTKKSMEEQFREFNASMIECWDNEEDECWNNC